MFGTSAVSKPTFSFGTGGTTGFGANAPATAAAATSNPVTSFNFGIGTAPNAISSAAPQSMTTFGGFGTSSGATSFGISQPSAATATTANFLISSFSTHPFQYIQQCYDPNSLNYRFRAYFYNLVEGGVIKYAINKPLFISDRLWTQIRSDNPDPEKLVPIIANGFEDLKTRVSWQEEQLAAQKSKMEELDKQTTTMIKKADLELTTQLQQVQRQQIALVKRILSIMKTYEIVRKAGQKLNPTEVALKQKVDQLMTRLSQSPCFDQNAIRSLQYQIQALQETDQLDALKPVKGLQIDAPEASSAIVNALMDQQKGIKAIASSVQKDLKDLETMKFGFQI